MLCFLEDALYICEFLVSALERGVWPKDFRSPIYSAVSQPQTELYSMTKCWSGPVWSFLLLHALSSPFCKLLFSCPSCTLHVYWTFDSSLLLVRFVCLLRPLSGSGFGPGLLHRSVSHRTSLCELKISLRHLDLGPIPGVSLTLPAPTRTILSILKIYKAQHGLPHQDFNSLSDVNLSCFSALSGARSLVVCF